MDEYYDSWEKMIAAGVKWILPAHGAPFPVDKLVGNMRKNKSKNLVHY
jgi:glyoxylase-like metal-dependent hydrolase (beta-lactamase superfamily II)